MNQILQLSAGNPGAMDFLLKLTLGDIADNIAGLTILPKIEKCNIKGTDIYVLYSDLCNKDIQLVAKLCKNCPDDVLKDACSRQDYSGRELIKQYIN